MDMRPTGVVPFKISEAPGFIFTSKVPVACNVSDMAWMLGSKGASARINRRLGNPQDNRSAKRVTLALTFHLLDLVHRTVANQVVAHKGKILRTNLAAWWPGFVNIVNRQID